MICSTLEPLDIIVGTLYDPSGKKIGQVCQGDASDNSKARECYPQRVELHPGYTINFTWGITEFEEVTLFSVLLWITIWRNRPAASWGIVQEYTTKQTLSISIVPSLFLRF